MQNSAVVHADTTSTIFIGNSRALGSRMGLLARSVALRGEAVFLIKGDRLLSCADWDVSTRDGIPRAYRMSVAEAGGNRSETVLAQEVLHFRIASDPVAPWIGQSPLSRSQLSAQLLQQVETALM